MKNTNFQTFEFDEKNSVLSVVWRQSEKLDDETYKVELVHQLSVFESLRPKI